MSDISNPENEGSVLNSEPQVLEAADTQAKPVVLKEVSNIKTAEEVSNSEVVDVVEQDSKPAENGVSNSTPVEDGVSNSTPVEDGVSNLTPVGVEEITQVSNTTPADELIPNIANLSLDEGVTNSNPVEVSNTKPVEEVSNPNAAEETGQKNPEKTGRSAEACPEPLKATCKPYELPPPKPCPVLEPEEPGVCKDPPKKQCVNKKTS